ncbi:MAG: hypothetical protein ACRYF9_26850 [Janthinobacterium lividum]
MRRQSRQHPNGCTNHPDDVAGAAQEVLVGVVLAAAPGVGDEAPDEGSADGAPAAGQD